MRIARGTSLPILAATGILLLAGCASGGDAAGGGNGELFASIDNTYGTTEVAEKPERVAAVSWASQDDALALGVVPVGFAAATYGDDDGDGILPWTMEALEKLGATGDKLPVLFDETDGIDFEGVSTVEPDVILAASSGLSEEDYTTLTEIAPTVSFPEIPWATPWRDAARAHGKALGLSDETDDLIAELEGKIETEVAKYPSIAGKTVLLTYLDPSDLSKLDFYTAIDTRVKYLEDLGLTIPQSVQDLSDGESFYGTVSAENIDAFNDVDVIVAYGSPSLLPTLQADPLLGQLRAVKNGSIAFVDDNTPLASAVSPSLLSLPWGLKDYVALIGGAADKVS